MKDYLKMSDVFPGGVCVGTEEWMNGWFEVRHVGGPSIDESCDGGYSERDANYVAHAINSHDELVEEVERLRSTLQQCVDALYIADKFCGNHTAAECGDEIAIPISDALVAASKIVAPPNLGVTND